MKSLTLSLVALFALVNFAQANTEPKAEAAAAQEELPVEPAAEKGSAE